MLIGRILLLGRLPCLCPSVVGVRSRMTPDISGSTEFFYFSKLFGTALVNEASVESTSFIMLLKLFFDRGDGSSVRIIAELI